MTVIHQNQITKEKKILLNVYLITPTQFNNNDAVTVFYKDNGTYSHVYLYLEFIISINP